MTVLGWNDKVVVTSAPTLSTPEQMAQPVDESLPEASQDSDTGEEITSPLAIKKWSDIRLDPPKKTPVLIGDSVDGCLRLAELMLFVAASKAGKTWAALELACAIASGGKWLDMPCKKGRVLYLNFELLSGSLEAADGRLSKVWACLEANGITQGADANLHVVDLRGNSILDEGIKALCNKVVESLAVSAAEDGEEPYGYYSAIIFDPFYACSNVDENSAAEIKGELRTLQNLAKATGAAVVYIHHHAKGLSGGKESIDRGAGSGVHGRLPDQIVDMSELAVPDSTLQAIRERYNDEFASVYRVSFNVRDFKPKKPLNVVFSCPIHYLAPADLQLDSCSERGKDTKSEKTNEQIRKRWSARNKAIARALFEHQGEIDARTLYRELDGIVDTGSWDSFRKWFDNNHCDYMKVKEEYDGSKIWMVRLRE